MKKLFMILILLITLCPLMAMNTAKSIFYADSYMLRSHGVEANYWNPARISSIGAAEIWLPLVNSGIYVANNALDLDTYNYFVSRDTLRTEDKERILQDVDGALRLSSGGNISVFGIKLGNSAVSSSVNIYAKGALSEKFLRLALYGNDQEEYSFAEANNNASSMAFTDFTFGMGGLKIPGIPPEYPQVIAGFSASLLVGLYSVSTQDYQGYFSSNIDSGVNAYQEIKVKTGIGGYGFKSMLGVYSEITPYLEAGITLDNILGGINWAFSNEMDSYYISADSIYAAQMDEDFFEQENYNEELGSFSTSLPPELRLALMYKHRYAVLSMDWVHGFKESTVTNAVGRLSLGASFLPSPGIPISCGISLPNSGTPFKVSYGVGFKIKNSELGLAVQTFDSLFPGNKSKGISFATNLRIGF